MRCLVFAGLLAFQIVLGICDEPELIVTRPLAHIDLRGPRSSGKLEYCKLETSGKKLYSVYPKNDAPGYYIGNDEYCAQDVPVKDLSYAGSWTMITVADNKTLITKFKIQIQREIPPRPSSAIHAYAGQWIKIWLDANDTDVRSCDVTAPNSWVFDPTTEKIEGASPYGLCGIRMLANESMNGQWEFHQQVGEYLINRARFNVKVLNEIDRDSAAETEMSERTWIIGERGKYDIYDPDVAFCRFTRPDGRELPVTFGSCVLEVSVVNPYHEGTWRATYATLGNMKLEHRDIRIKTKDPNFMEGSYSPGIGEEINLLCKTARTNLKFCTFVRPDNYLLHLPVGVGNDNYSYYGKGYSDRFSPGRDYGECGVTIHKPSAVDFGRWTCEMGLMDGTTRGSIINVVGSRALQNDDTKRIDDSPIFVRRGDSFKIKCRAYTALEYCWLTSPNGTAYGVAKSGSRSTLKYDGKGFTMGECGATVPASNDTDSGEWICHLGIKGGSEIEEKVSVKVTESHLIANIDTVYAGENTKLTCRTFVGEEGSLRYCRWVRPNGHGINEADASRYKLSQEIDRCGLTILDLQPEDVGEWTCFASLTTFTGDEESATVRLRSMETVDTNTASILSIVLGSGLFIIMFIGASYAALLVYGRRNAGNTKKPTLHYPDNYAIPNEIKTGAESIPNKDYRY